MSTNTNIIGNTYLTLKDKFNQMEDGEVTATIIDLLSTTNEILEDAVIEECNDGTSHKTSVRNGLPKPEFRQFYQGVNCSKGTYTQIVEPTAMLEDYSEVDKSFADLNNDYSQFRLNEASGHLEGMNQVVKTNLFYGNKGVNHSAFDGLANRYNKINTDKTSIGSRVINGGSTGDENTSIWFITWGTLHTHLIYPKGSKAGLQHTNLGEVTARDKDNKLFQAYRDHFKWDLGLAIRDFRSTCRIANIPASTSALKSVDLIDLLTEGYYTIRRFSKTGKTVIYVNETIQCALHKQARKDSNINLNLSEYEGKPIVKFLDIPIKCCDEILNTEEKVSEAA